jgi:MoaA/NifB/PqqE/SkfB family radical SAM enzyme
MSKELIKPEELRIEAASVCQLRCPSCPTATGKIRESVVGSGLLKKEDFQMILEAGPWIKRVELSNWGEIFLNKDLPEILRIAFERGVTVHASNGVNLNHATEQMLEALVKYRMEHLTCSIDGASPETYRHYRVGGNFDSVISNIRRINSLKQVYASSYPLLTWQFVIFGHNEHELPRAKEMAAELDMAFRPKLSWDEEFSPIRDREFVKRETGLEFTSRSEHLNVTHKNVGRTFCLQLWWQTQVNYNGDVLGCCVNHWGSFGNVLSEGVLEGLNNERISYARAMLMGQVPEREDIPCTRCSKYLDMKRFNCYLTEEEIRRKSVS